MKYRVNLEKIRRSPFVTNKHIGLLGRGVFVLVTPLIFTWIMFDPFLRIQLESNTNEPQFISRLQINDGLTSSSLAEFFQTSLKLGWYQLCFENHGALVMGGQTVVDREDRGNITVQVREVVPSPYSNEYRTLNAHPFKEADCMKIDNDADGINVGTTTVELGSRINDRPNEIIMLNDKEFQMDFSLDLTKLVLYIKQDWFALIIKYLVILILWSSLILLFRSMRDFLLGHSKSIN